ncbi:MAG: phenylacetate--CoA ligase [Candidatus Rokubacteria bacterium]|nr:phenylacetate--CoA ligase [Candidatus Rokubacteria bacterium]
MWNRDAETLDAGARARLQGARLRETVAWARARVGFYRDRLPATAPDRLEDLAALPFTRKSDLRAHYPFGLFAVRLPDIARLHASSGTKGKPTVVGYTREDLDVWREVMARMMVAAGCRPGDLLHNAFGYGLFTGGLGFHQGAERVGMTVVPASSAPTARHRLLLQDFRPAGLCATPSFALHIAEAMRAAGGAPDGCGLRYGMYGAEPWSEGIRRALEDAFGCPAYDVYGLSEIIGPGVAGECEARDGMHVADDHFLPEIVDPASDAPVEGGREGELVLTTLTKRGMPVIRYRTGDLTAVVPGACACGRTSARIRRIKGRSDDMLIVRGVNLYPSEVEATLLAVTDLAPHYQLIVDRRETMATLEIEVEPTEATVARAGGLAGLVGLRDEIAHRLRAALGLSVRVTLVAPRSLPRSEGKAVRVIERR